MRNLDTDPLWKPEDLGKPIPDDPHAVSVCLPTWDSVIRYEEGDPEVLARAATHAETTGVGKISNGK